MSTFRSPGLRGVIGVLAVGIALSLGTPAPAFAHNYLVDSTPEEGGTLTELPERFSVTTNDPLLDVSGEASGFALEIRDGSGGFYGDGCLTIEGATLSTPAALGEPGEYTVGWQVVSADGHTVDGEFAFTWQPAAEFAPAPSEDAPPVCDTAAATGGAPAATAATESTEPTAEAGAVSGTDLLWVLGTVVVVAVILFGTLLLLTRRRATVER